MLKEEEINNVLYNIEQISKILKKFRIKRKVFKDELGIPLGRMNEWKKRTRNPNVKTAKKICDRFGIDYDIFVSKKLNVKMEYKIIIGIEE